MRQQDDQYDFLYKLVLVGDMNVGKTFLLSRYVKGQIPKNTGPTIGVEFATKTVALESGGTVKAQIWDTAGQERYRAITTAHYRRAVGALLVYDVTQMKTFQNVRRWVEELRDHAEPDIVIMLVGNKSDIAEASLDSREVPVDTAKQMAERNGMLFLETSAVNGAKVKEAFETLLNEINKKRSVDGGKQSIAEGDPIRPGDISRQRDACC